MPLVARPAERRLRLPSTGSVVDDVFKTLSLAAAAPPRNPPPRNPPTGGRPDDSAKEVDSIDAFKREWKQVVEQGYL